jgi:hypothetical protein
VKTIGKWMHRFIGMTPSVACSRLALLRQNLVTFRRFGEAALTDPVTVSPAAVPYLRAAETQAVAC